MPYGTVNADVIGTSVANSNLGAGNATRFKNRIINGDMRIDQRNAGAATTPASSTYLVDRWQYTQVAASKFTFQQNAASVTPPVGFSNYLGATVASAVTVASGDYYNLSQTIEGFNTADLGFGTANAKSVTLSFWVYSSLTGTFGGSLRNAGGTRSYPFSYTINTANTWTQAIITIAGDTSGTWVGATNAGSMNVFFGLGVGSTSAATAGSWQTGNYLSATGAINPIATASATWYLTGVQLEVGSSATGFEYVDYTTQLAMCQRYFSKTYNTNVVPGTATYNGSVTARVGAAESFSYAGYFTYPVSMRTDPTITIYSPGNGTSGQGVNNIAGNFNAGTTQPAGTAGVNIQASNVLLTSASSNYSHVVASAEL